MKIKTYGDGSARLLWPWRDIALTTADFAALREFFQAERDETLGRWRDPENPDWVVYPDEIPTVVWAVDEKTGAGEAWSRVSVETLTVFIKSADVARRYFAAHPEPKPWDAAQPGEVWALTINNDREEVFRCGETGLYQLKTGNPLGRLLSCSHNKVTAGRRIWPEPNGAEDPNSSGAGQ